MRFLSRASFNIVLLGMLGFGLSGVRPFPALAQAHMGEAASSASGTTAHGRPWTVATSVSRRGYGFPVFDWRVALGNTRVDQPSPDGSRFYILTDWGDEACSCAMQRLDVYRTEAVQTWLVQRRPGLPVPERSLTRPVRPNRTIFGNAFAFPRWTRSGNAIRFIGDDEAGRNQLFHYDLTTGELRQVTQESQQTYAHQFGDGAAVYERLLPNPVSELPPIVAAPRRSTPDGEHGVGDIFIEVRQPAGRPQWVAKAEGRPEWVLPIGNVPGINVQFSPDERYAVILTRDSRFRPIQYFLADLNAQSIRAIGAASHHILTDILWFNDSARVVISGVRRPVLPDHNAGTDSDEIIGVFDTRSFALREIGARPDLEARFSWGQSDNELILTAAIGGARTVYTLRGERWLQTRPGPAPVIANNAANSGLEVRIRQDANTPPRLFAMANGVERVFDAPDPALAGVDIIAQQQYSWAMPDGARLTGGLLLPRNRRPGERVPLVVEVGHHYPQLFLPDGHVTTWYAPQLLAANGFAVLELNSMDLPGMQTAAEGEQFTARLEAVLDALDREGVIDPARVGLIGHSRAGWVTYFAITHPGRHTIRTAEIIDATTVSFVQYVTDNASGLNSRHDSEGPNGGDFWGNREAWLRNEVSFNVNRVRGSTLFADHGIDGRTADAAGPLPLSTIGAFQLNRKPVDYLFVPQAGHILTRYADRRAAMSLSLDWMRFWLLGQEDPDPAKAEQYARWRLMQQTERENGSAVH